MQFAGELIFLVLIFTVSFLYSSVGHGGASGYLALMALFNFTSATMRPSALILNALVSGVAFLMFYRTGFFRWQLFRPFAFASVPAAFLGGMVVIDEKIYARILGVVLLLSVARLITTDIGQRQRAIGMNTVAAVSAGAMIGFISGVIGIGGGIILSPLILLLGWANMKETAAVTSLFILVNSLAGLSGMITQDITIGSEIWLMLAAGFTGGLIGAHFGSSRFTGSALRYLLSAVLVVASLKLLIS